MTFETPCIHFIRKPAAKNKNKRDQAFLQKSNLWIVNEFVPTHASSLYNNPSINAPLWVRLLQINQFWFYHIYRLWGKSRRWNLRRAYLVHITSDKAFPLALSVVYSFITAEYITADLLKLCKISIFQRAWKVHYWIEYCNIILLLEISY